MKLRILGNKLRFRLSKQEVKELCDGKHIREQTHFPNGNSLTYQVTSRDTVDQPEALYESQKITIQIPSPLLANWHQDDRVGIYHQLNSGNTPFEIAIEKDFQCLHKRPGEDESDNYPNPAK